MTTHPLPTDTAGQNSLGPFVPYYSRTAPLPAEGSLWPVNPAVEHEHQCATHYFARARCDCAAIEKTGGAS